MNDMVLWLPALLLPLFSESVVKKYNLAPDYDDRLGGELSHIVVMQHASEKRLQKFLDDLKAAI